MSIIKIWILSFLISLVLAILCCSCMSEEENQETKDVSVEKLRSTPDMKDQATTSSLVMLGKPTFKIRLRQPLTTERPNAVSVHNQKTTAPVPSRRPKAVRQPATDSAYRSLIMTIAQKYKIPSGILYGVHTKESSRLDSNWESHWHLANTLTKSDGPCIDRYGWTKCNQHWNALQAICSQKRHGRPICDPNQVRVSYAGAMGPTQHMPGILLRRDGNSYRWAAHATDYDGDGVIDPHHLPDALATTARYIRIAYDKKCGQRSWQCATNKYFGANSTGYFEGVDSKKGVYYWWQKWCQYPGNCS